TLTLNASTSYTFAGLLTDSGTAAGTLSPIKNGPGTLTLSASESFTGPLTVNGGTVLVNGALAADVAVNGGTLGGTGSIGGTATAYSYLGGDGNDFTLTVASPVQPPTGNDPPPAAGDPVTVTAAASPFAAAIGTFDPATGVWCLRNVSGPGSPDAGHFAF